MEQYQIVQYIWKKRVRIEENLEVNQRKNQQISL